MYLLSFFNQVFLYCMVQLLDQRYGGIAGNTRKVPDSENTLSVTKVCRCKWKVTKSPKVCAKQDKSWLSPGNGFFIGGAQEPGDNAAESTQPVALVEVWPPSPLFVHVSEKQSFAKMC